MAFFCSRKEKRRKKGFARVLLQRTAKRRTRKQL